MGSVFTLPLPVPGQVSLCAEGFPALGALVRLHGSVEPLVLKELETILKAPPAQRTVVCDSSPWVDSFDRGFPRGHGVQGNPMSRATLPMFAHAH